MAPRSFSLETLQDAIPTIFEQAQSSVANHKKNCVALHKHQLQASDVTKTTKDGGVKLVGEKVFRDVFMDMVSRVLSVKKGPAAADRVVRFVGSYLQYINEKASKHKAGRPPVASTSSQTEDEYDETPASRFVSRLLEWLFRGFNSKNKNVRFRTISIVSAMIPGLGEVDEDVFTRLRTGLIERTNDKESIIRAHAIAALSKLVGSEDPDELKEDETSIEETILHSLCYDPAAEVRRASLLHVPLTPVTLPTILTRTRDVDAVTRQLVYNSVLLSRLEHPQQLTITQREQVVRDGLGDRESVVRAAAGKVIAAWFDTILAESEKSGGNDSDEVEITKSLVRLLQMFDVFGQGETVAVDALTSVFVTRPDILESVTFNESFWNELTAESALLARVFLEHCLSTNNDALVESVGLPVVTAFAFRIQEIYNILLDLMQEDEDEDAEDTEEARDRREEELAAGEFILGQILKITVKLDFTDEIGRRKLFAVTRDLLAHNELPRDLIERCLDILMQISSDERDLIRVVVEVIHELRDGDEEVIQETRFMEDETQSDTTRSTMKRDRSLLRTKQPHEMSVEERMEADVIDMRCLTICAGMLERVNGSFEDNSVLEGILGELIIPAVKKRELAMREKGLICLGLCCLIAKKMALNSFQLFLSQVQSSPEELKVKVLQIVFDLLMVYDHEFLARSDEIAERIITFLLHTLENEESRIVQAVLCVGISKLLLSDLVTDPRVLISLVLAYVSPATADNLELRQCLSYFFPVYCYSSPKNQHRMQSIFVSAYDLVSQVFTDLEDDQQMVLPHQFGMLFIDWTNPQKAAKLSSDPSTSSAHVELAIGILKALYDSERSDDDQKTLLQLLGHLYIPDGLEPRSLIKLDILLSHLQDQCLFENPSLDKIFSRFLGRFMKQFSRDMRRVDHTQFTRDEEFVELYQFIGVSPPLVDESGDAGEGSNSHVPEESDLSKLTGRQRSMSVATDASSANEQILSSSPTPTPRPLKTRTKPKPAKDDYASNEQVDYSDKENTSIETPRKGAKRLRKPGPVASTFISPVKKRSRQAQINTKIPGSDDEKMYSNTEDGSVRGSVPKRVVGIVSDGSSVVDDSDF